MEVQRCTDSLKCWCTLKTNLFFERISFGIRSSAQEGTKDLRIHVSTKLAFIFCTGVAAVSLARYALGSGALFLLAGLLACTGVAALVFAASRAIKLRTTREAHALVVVAVAWLLWVFAPLETGGVYVKFYLDRPAYDAAVLEASQGHVPQCVTAKTCSYQSDSNANLAFPWEGILDNWIGVIHDPSGGVMDAESAKGIFGGDLLGCEHLDGPYYLCSFT